MVDFNSIRPKDFLSGLVAKALQGDKESRAEFAKTGPGAQFRPPEGEIFISSKNGQRAGRDYGVEIAKHGLADKPDQVGLYSTGSRRATSALSGLLQDASRLDTAA